MRTHRLGFLVVPSLIMALVSPAMSASWERLDSGIAPINSWTPALTDWVYPNGVELIEVFAVTSDSLHNLVMTSVFANDAGAPFSLGTINLGGNLIYPPSAVQVANADNTSHLEVFGIGTDHALYHQTNDNGAGWSGWASLGKPSAGLCSGPSAVSWSQTIDRIDVFVVGCDNRLWQRWFEAGAWHGWFSPNNAVSFAGSAPVAAVARGAIGSLDIFVVNTASKHVVDIWFNGSWHSTDIPGTAADASVTALALNGYPSAFAKSATASGLIALEGKNGFPGQFWPPNFWSALTGPPIVVQDFILDVFEVYYLDGSSQVRRDRYRPGGSAQGTWIASSLNLTGVAFSGGLNGYNPQRIAGIVVFAAKNDGTTWFALDTD